MKINVEGKEIHINDSDPVGIHFELVSTGEESIAPVMTRPRHRGKLLWYAFSTSPFLVGFMLFLVVYSSLRGEIGNAALALALILAEANNNITVLWREAERRLCRALYVAGELYAADLSVTVKALHKQLTDAGIEPVLPDAQHTQNFINNLTEKAKDDKVKE